MTKINGKNVDAKGVSVEKYLLDAGYDINHVAVEMNGNILPKAKYAQTSISESDTLEVVGFVGGG